MILTLNDKREISQIIASFTDDDYERINSEVDRLCKRCDPIAKCFAHINQMNTLRTLSTGWKMMTVTIRKKPLNGSGMQ